METLPDGEPKMFGVLLVRAKSGELGLLRAFSGKLDGSFHHPGWVPPMLELRPSELEISTKRRLAVLKQQLQDLGRTELYRNRQSLRKDWERRGLALEDRLKTRKRERDKRRAAGVPEAELASLSKHDSREKREFKREVGGPGTAGPSGRANHGPEIGAQIDLANLAKRATRPL